MGLLMVLGMLGLILDGRTALFGASQGVELCLTSVIPSLLPFLCISMALADRLSGKRLPGSVSRILGIPGGAEALLVPGFLGGYPAGAACIGRAFSAGRLDRRDAELLLGSCCQPGPAFLFGIAAQQFSSPLAPWALWGCIVLSARAASGLLPKPSGTVRIGDGRSGDALSRAGAAMGKICLCVILFRVGLSFLTARLHPDGPGLVILEGILELTNGCCDLRNIPSEETRFVAAAGLLSFGGLCVGLQTAQVTEGLGLKYYWLGKGLQTVFAVLFGFLLVKKRILPAVLLTAALIFLPKAVAFWKERVYNAYDIQKRSSGRKPCFSERK